MRLANLEATAGPAPGKRCLGSPGLRGLHGKGMRRSMTGSCRSRCPSDSSTCTQAHTYAQVRARKRTPTLARAPSDVWPRPLQRICTSSRDKDAHAHDKEHTHTHMRTRASPVRTQHTEHSGKPADTRKTLFTRKVYGGMNAAGECKPAETFARKSEVTHP